MRGLARRAASTGENGNRAVATVVRAGKRLAVIAVDVADVGRNRLAARATLSFAVLDRR